MVTICYAALILLIVHCTDAVHVVQSTSKVQSLACPMMMYHLSSIKYILSLEYLNESDEIIVCD